MNNQYPYEIRNGDPQYSVPYVLHIYTPDGTRLTNIGGHFIHTIAEGKRDALKMAKKHHAGEAGKIVHEGIIDLTPKPKLSRWERFNRWLVS